MLKAPKGVLAALVAATFLAGCGDPALERQAKFEKEFNTLLATYENTVTGSTALHSASPSSESLAALRALAEQAKSLSGGTPKQQESATELAASIFRISGGIELASAGHMEAEQEVVRGVAMSAATIAADLDAIAAAAEAIDYSGATRSAEATKSRSAQATRALQEAMRAVELPLGQLVDQIESGATRISQLDAEAAVLLRKSRESTPAAGLAFVEEAAKIQGESRSEQRAIGEKAIDADNLESALNLTKVALADAKGLQTAAIEALDFVASYKAEVDGSAAKLREMAGDMRKKADGLMASIAAERAGPLKAAYEAAATDFSNAASSDALRMVIMAEELRLKMSEVQGHGAQGRMLAATGGAGLAEVKSAAEAAITALKEKAMAAAEAMDASADEKLAELKTFIGETKKAADGMTVDKLLAPPAIAAKPSATAKPKSDGASSSGRSMSGGAGGGVEDIEAWVAAFNAAVETEPSKAIEMSLATMDDSTPVGKAMKEMSAPLLSAMAPLFDAMQAKFGTTKLDLGGMGGAMGGMGGGLGGGVTKLEKVSLEDDRAVYKDANGKEMAFVKTSSGWKADTDAMLAEAGVSEEQIAQSLPMVQAMMAPLMGAMKKAAADVAAKIESGEITSAEAAGAAMQAAIQEAAAGMFGGGGGGRRGRGAPGGDN
ncbi:MAG: hypothetical protein ACKO3W_10240 [bacterium]